MSKRKRTNFNFSKSTVTRQCRHCGGEHKVVYALFMNRTKHLVMHCDSKRVNVYIPFEPDLPIPSEPSRQVAKSNLLLKQTTIGQYLVGRGKRSIIA